MIVVIGKRVINIGDIEIVSISNSLWIIFRALYEGKI